MTKVPKKCPRCNTDIRLSGSPDDGFCPECFLGFLVVGNTLMVYMPVVRSPLWVCGFSPKHILVYVQEGPYGSSKITFPLDEVREAAQRVKSACKVLFKEQDDDYEDN